VNDGSKPVPGRAHSSSFGRVNGVQTTVSADKSKPAKAPKIQPSSNTGTRLRPNAPQARDARVDRDSMTDFSEFLRSTGPANVDPVTRSSPLVPGQGGTNGTARNASGSAPRVSASTTLRRSESSAGRSRLQARDATVGRDSIGDLISVIREGPADGDHRISRTVAPFRSTMDSDQMSGAVGGKAVDAVLPDPRFSQTSTNPSSINSQSALLNNNSKNKPLPVQSQNDLDDEDMMPKRKQRRARDMYAIDFSDEEEEDGFEIVPKPKKKPTEEESLADFLRNVAPPPDNMPTPLVITDIPKPKKKASFGSRWGIGTVGSSVSGPVVPQKQASLNRAATAPTAAPSQKTYTPIAAQFTTSQPNPHGSSRSGDYASRLDVARNPSTGRVVQKSYEPREAIHTTSRTDELADFLRSAPPPSMAEPRPFMTSAMQEQDEPAGFTARMFGRRKKVAGY